MSALSDSSLGWITQVDERLVYTGVLAVALLAATRLGVWAVERAVSDERWRYTSRKVIRTAAASIFFVTTIGIWAQRLQGFLLILGATGAGFAIALAPVLVSLAGWGLIMSSGLYKVGDRVEVGGVIGDVTDIGMIRTSLLEIGNWVQADQLTGRVVAVSNGAVFRDPVFNYTQGAPYIWDEFTVPVAYGPQWERAEAVIRETVSQGTREIEVPASHAMRRLPGMSLLGVPDTHAQVYVSLTEHWVACTARYVVPARSRRTVKHRLQVETLKALAQGGIEIASPSLTVVRYPAPRTWKEES